MNKPQVGIASVWYEGNPCNMHLQRPGRRRSRKASVAAGLVGMRFNTIGVSDGISMGTEGMSYSLQSRDLIADSIETVMGAQWYDANISHSRLRQEHARLPDRHGPAQPPVADGLRRHDPRRPLATARQLDIVSAFQSYGEYLAGTHRRTRAAGDRAPQPVPAPGACGGMYTANTMASAIEALGMSLPYSSSIPADDPAKLDECFARRRGHPHLLERDIKPRDIMTREAFENAMVVVMALGGSTNAVLHLIAMARAVGVPLTIDDFQKVSDRVPFLADLKPSGKYVHGGPAQRRRHAGRDEVPARRRAARRRLPDRDRQDAWPRTCATCRASTPARTSFHPLENPIKPTGHIQILRGNLAPDGAVAKITGKEGLTFRRPGQGLRLRRRHARTRWSARRSPRATWSSSATKAPRAGPACPRCSRRPRPSWAPAWARTWR